MIVSHFPAPSNWMTCIGVANSGAVNGVEAPPTKHPLWPLCQSTKRGIRWPVVNGFRSKEIAKWAKRHLSADSLVVSDGLACFAAVTGAGCQHIGIVTGGGPKGVSVEAFTWVNTMISNVKRSMNGAYHAINHKHLPRYLAEFSYCFNRRFVLEDMLPRLCYVAARTPPVPMRLLTLAEFHG